VMVKGGIFAVERSKSPLPFAAFGIIKCCLGFTGNGVKPLFF
jgi:hypothetical protein